MRQLDLFPNQIRKVKLQADSAKKAWWQLELLELNGEYFIKKQSGIPGKVLDTRKWPQSDLKRAIMTYNRKVKAKLNPKRKSPRKYQITCCND